MGNPSSTQVVFKYQLVSCCRPSHVFAVCRYGRPDPLLRREHDVRVSLQMASVQYVHTQRFQAEVVAFIQHFTQLQDVLGRQRAAIEGQTVGSLLSLSCLSRSVNGTFKPLEIKLDSFTKNSKDK